MKKTSILLIIVGFVLFTWNLGNFYTSTKALNREDEQVQFDLNTSTQTVSVNYDVDPKIGQEIGTLKFPSLKQAFPIYQGTDKHTLKKGVGHVITSAMPGDNNHSILSGHRDTVFRNLKHLKENEKIIVSTNTGDFLYKIKKIRIVDSDDQTIMTPKPRAILTLTTCYPFEYIGPAPQRYIITGELISTRLR